jgi:hypothetical protein
MRFEPRLFQPDDFDDDFRAAESAADFARWDAMPEDAVPELAAESLADSEWEASTLPPEFAALAEQLTCDANHLAACYPAGAARLAPVALAAVEATVEPDDVKAPVATTVVALPAPSFSMAAAGGLVGGIVALLLLMSSLASRWGGESPSESPLAGPTRPVFAPQAIPGTNPLATFPTAPAAVTPGLPASDAGEMPVRVLRSLTGPELEGLIDLLEHPDGEKPTLSI